MSDKRKILFVRGFQKEYGKSESDTLSCIKERFPDFEYDVLEPNYNDLESVINSVDYIKGKYYDFIIGHSAGGFLAMYFSNFTNLKTILINPLMYPDRSTNIKNLKVVNYLNKLKQINDNNLDKSENMYELVLLGTNDEVVNYLDFAESKHFQYSKEVIFVEQGHKIDAVHLLDNVLHN